MSSPRALAASSSMRSLARSLADSHGGGRPDARERVRGFSVARGSPPAAAARGPCRAPLGRCKRNAPPQR